MKVLKSYKRLSYRLESDVSGKLHWRSEMTPFDKTHTNSY